MSNLSTVLDLKIGEKAVVLSCKETPQTCRLLTLGILPNVTVVVIRKAPYGGTLYVKIAENFVALRPAEADSIYIHKI